MAKLQIHWLEYVYEGNSHKCTCFKHCNLTIYSGVYCGTSGLFISSMALKQTKIFYNKLKGKKQHGNEEKPLMKNIEQTDGKTLLLIFCNSHWFHTCYLSKHVCQKSDLHKKVPTCFHQNTMQAYCLFCMFAWFDESHFSLGLNKISKELNFQLLLDKMTLIYVCI